MSTVLEAIDVLRTALQKKSIEQHVKDSFDHLASCLVLLNSSSPSVQMVQKLCTVLRHPFLPLYDACFQPALQLSSAVLSTLLGKVCSVEDESLRAGWDATAEVILSGILDFMDQKDSGNVNHAPANWEVLHRVVCEFFFPDSGGQPGFSLPLYLSAYSVLTETAARQVSVRNALRDEMVLGGERLGAAISRTRDYLILEALLMLFARLLPPAHNVPQAKCQRIKFVKEVFGSSKLFSCSTELLDIMQKTSETHWDNVEAQIVDVLAKCDITYPQPFSIDEIDVCGRIFPQPLATDRLIMDRQAFLANIVSENNDQCESLQIPYTCIRTIALDNSGKDVPKGKVLIMIHLTSPPSVARIQMDSTGESQLYAKFLLRNQAVGTFMEALRRRGVGKLNFLNPVTKKRKSNISIGSGFKLINDSSPIPPTASFEGKVHHVHQVYKTDVEESTKSDVIPVLPAASKTGSSFPADSEPTFKNENRVSEVLESAMVEQDPAVLHHVGPISPIDETSKPIQDPTLCVPLENTNLCWDCDELSEVSECEADEPTIDERMATGVSTSCRQEVRPVYLKVDRTPINGASGASSATETSKFTRLASKPIGRREGVVGSPPKGKQSTALNSPPFESSSTIQVDISPALLSNDNTFLASASKKIISNLPVTPRNFVSTDKLKETENAECGHSDTKSKITSAGQIEKGLSFPVDEPGKHTERTVPSFAMKHQARTQSMMIVDDATIPPKVAGNRRKRESSNKAVVKVDDEYAPPRKKRRNEKHENRVAKGSSRTVDHGVVYQDKFPALPRSCQETRRSSRIRQRQIVASSRIRASAMHDKSRTGKLAEDAIPTNDYNKIPIFSPHPTPSPIREISFLKTINGSTPLSSPIVADSNNIELDIHLSQSLVELKSANNVISSVTVAQEMPKAEEPRNSLEPTFPQQATSDTMQLPQRQFCIKNERIIDDWRISASPHIVDAGRVQEDVEHLIDLNENENLLQSSRPNVESTPRTNTVIIDLTTDNSPARENNKPLKTSAGLARQEANTQTPKAGSLEQSSCIDMEETASVPSPRNRRRSVTFASPIEQVLERKAKKSKAQVSSSNRSLVDNQRSRQFSPPSGCNSLSPLRAPLISSKTRGGPPDGIMSQKSKLSQASTHEQIANEVEIQDIVEILNEIQAVIVKGISDKFKHVKKDIQRGRDELIQQVLDDLQGMIVENVKYFNGLLHLEEDYCKNGQMLTRCWEDLIDSNDNISTQVQKVLKEHDQNISARSFPKTLPLKPGLLRRHENV